MYKLNTTQSVLPGVIASGIGTTPMWTMCVCVCGVGGGGGGRKWRERYGKLCQLGIQSLTHFGTHKV